MGDPRRPLLAAVALAAAAYLVAIGVGQGVGRLLIPSGGPGASVTTTLATYTALVAVSLVLTAMGGGPLGEHLGWRWPEGTWVKLAGLALLVGVGTTLAMRLTPAAGLGSKLRGVGPGVVLLTVLWGSLSEELFTRGWFQGALVRRLDRPDRSAWAGLSVPVTASGLLFGAMHLTLLARSAEIWTVCFILGFTTIVGLLAARARERTGSLLPAVVTHLAGNAGGVLGGMIAVAFHVAMYGRLPEL